MKKIIALIIFILSVALGLYVGGWCMFVVPIIEACKHFDAGTLTGVIIGTTVLKCIFASAVGSVIVYIGSIIAAVLNK